MSQRRPGRIRIALAAALTKALPCDVILAGDIWSNGHPDAIQIGAARWGVYATRNGTNLSVFSWDTMGECLKNGFTLDWKDYAEVEIHAKEKP